VVQARSTPPSSQGEEFVQVRRQFRMGAQYFFRIDRLSLLFGFEIGGQHFLKFP